MGFLGGSSHRAVARSVVGDVPPARFELPYAKVVMVGSCLAPSLLRTTNRPRCPRIARRWVHPPTRPACLHPTLSWAPAPASTNHIHTPIPPTPPATQAHNASKLEPVCGLFKTDVPKAVSPRGGMATSPHWGLHDRWLPPANGRDGERATSISHSRDLHVIGDGSTTRDVSDI